MSFSAVAIVVVVADSDIHMWYWWYWAINVVKIAQVTVSGTYVSDVYSGNSYP